MKLRVEAAEGGSAESPISFDLPRSVKGRRNEPDPEGVQQSLSRIGYKLEEALADLVDNSLDAKADTVLIRFFRRGDSLTRIAIVDDGQGISGDRLDECMQFGARIRHKTGDLGKYGMGLKSSSFSQCRSLSVISRTDGAAGGRRWTVDSIRQGWLCDELERKGCSHLLGADWSPVTIRPHGTAVIWTDIDKIRTQQSGVDAVLNKIFRTAHVHLGMVFHRFLASAGFHIVMDSFDEATGQAGPASEIRALDPFGYKRSGRARYPHNVSLVVDGSSLSMRCHIWPPNATEPEYKLGGKVSQRQGFYFYRNDRLIQAGGWNGWREEDTEPHLSLARVEVDLPTALDSAWGLNVQKSSVDAGQGLTRLLDTVRDGEWTFKQYIRDADATYRDAQPVAKDGPVIPGSGLPRKLQNFASGYFIFANGKGPPPRKVAIAWRRLQPNTVFSVDRERMTLILNTRHRRALSPNGVEAVVKLLTFLLVRDEFKRERVRVARAEWLDAVNDMLLIALGL